jgi:hypothetical protein
MRIVESLLSFRNIPQGNVAWPQQERVEVKLESDGVTVQFVVSSLEWETVLALVHDFQQSFGRFDPLFLEPTIMNGMTLRRSCREAEGFGHVFGQGDTTMSFETTPLYGHLVKTRTTVEDFDDHFEVFVTETAKRLFPPIEQRRRKAADLESWHKEFARQFEKMGCRVIQESELGWKDLAGLADLREHLRRSVFLPLSREHLYEKIAARVMPRAARLLPRGVLLYGAPGCGKTWSMKIIAGEAGLPVVILPCNAVLTKWFGESENRIASLFALCRSAGRMILLIDELDALARNRSESHEASARIVSVLLTEIDGFAESNEILLVGSVNDVNALDPAIYDRFDLKIEFRPPNPAQLTEALAYYARHLPADDVGELANRMEGWNFRQVARFAENVLRRYVSSLDLSALETQEPPLPGKQDYLETLDAKAT